MWDLYGRSDKAIAIRGTVGGMKAAFDLADKISVSIGVVNYIDFENPDLDRVADILTDKYGRQNTFGKFLIKRKSFEHERELRALVMDSTLAKEGNSGTNVSIELNPLIDSVYIAPNAPGWFRQSVKEVVRNSDLLTLPEDRILQSDLDSEPVF